MTSILLASANTRFWAGVVLLFVAAVAWLAVKTTRGLAGGYIEAPISERVKGFMMLFHGLGSLILALIIPNNFLVKIPWFSALYAQDGLWIAASIVVLLFLFLMGIGIFFTMLTNLLKK
jgi:hypothetical protein